MIKSIRKFLSSFVRNSEGGHLLEVFFVSSITSILTIRFFLKITDYPQLGGEGIHIAHMLWGGVFMLLALVLLLAFLNKEARSAAALLGGVGFGTFIDELGKFLTSDNNYFFQPTIALIYIIFVLLFLLFRTIERYKPLTKKEYLVNALEIVKEVVGRDLSKKERRKALNFIEKSDFEDEFTRNLKRDLLGLENLPSEQEGKYEDIKDFLSDLYEKLASQRWFAPFVIVLTSIIYLISLLRSLLIVSLFPNLPFAQWGQIVFSIVSGIFVLIGIWYLNKDRLFSFHMFKRAALVSILLTQFFLFYLDQFAALIGLLFSLVILLATQYMIEQERQIQRRPRG